MKQTIRSCKDRLAMRLSLHTSAGYLGTLCLLALSAFLFVGCQKDLSHVQEDEALVTANKSARAQGEFRTYYEGLDWQTVWELQQARAATAKYKNIENAIRDGYKDIDVKLPNMGFHYMNTDYVDATIEIRHPEILVYNKLEDGSFKLVAVEYAVPLNLSDTAPEGFSGTDDVWTHHTGFGLWLLHAWVWEMNPDGVFNPTNPLIPAEWVD